MKSAEIVSSLHLVEEITLDLLLLCGLWRLTACDPLVRH